MWYIYLAVAFTTCMILFSLIKSIANEYIKFEREKFHVDNFGAYIVALDYNMKKAYDIIYKDRILIYSLEATKIDEVQFQAASKAFIKLAMDMLGDTIKGYLVNLFGSDDRLYFIMAEYFNNRFEEDEIRKDAQHNLMEREDI